MTMYLKAIWNIVIIPKSIIPFQIGCMIAMCPIYPATCNPKDILMAMKAMQKRYYFTDVHAFGQYPEHILKY